MRRARSRRPEAPAAPARGPRAGRRTRRAAAALGGGRATVGNVTVPAGRLERRAPARAADAAGVDAEADGPAEFGRPREHPAQAVRIVDVARIEADLGDARLERLERERRGEVNVGNQGDRRRADEFRQGVGVGKRRDRDAHEVAPRGRKTPNLGQRLPRVSRVRGRHGLDADWVGAADRHGADLDRPARTPRESFVARHGRHYLGRTARLSRPRPRPFGRLRRSRLERQKAMARGGGMPR
jgi:hypothetical protein